MHIKLKGLYQHISIYIFFFLHFSFVFFVLFSIYIYFYLFSYILTFYTYSIYIHTHTHFEGLIFRLSSRAAISSYYKKCWLSMTNKNNASSSQEPKHQILHVISSYRTWFKGSIIHKKKKPLLTSEML